MQQRMIVGGGGLLAMAGVILGAFGAHALEPTLAERGTKAVWETAVDYQMWHALGLLFLAFLPKEFPLRRIAMLFTGGVLLFSGSLYWLALGGPTWLGPITPLGGLSLILGWATLVVTAFRAPAAFAR